MADFSALVDSFSSSQKVFVFIVSAPRLLQCFAVALSVAEDDSPFHSLFVNSNHGVGVSLGIQNDSSRIKPEELIFFSVTPAYVHYLFDSHILNIDLLEQGDIENVLVFQDIDAEYVTVIPLPFEVFGRRFRLKYTIVPEQEIDVEAHTLIPLRILEESTSGSYGSLFESVVPSNLTMDQVVEFVAVQFPRLGLSYVFQFFDSNGMLVPGQEYGRIDFWDVVLVDVVVRGLFSTQERCFLISRLCSSIDNGRNCFVEY